MKKNFIYALIACFTLSLAACSTDPEDATSKHVYGENENPYLKTNADAVVSTKAEFPISRLEAKTVKLTDYAEKFHTYLGMTVDETLAALSNGSVVFYPINISKNCWNRTAPTKGTNGWYYNTAGGVCDAASGIASIELDATKKELVLNVLETASVGTHEWAQLRAQLGAQPMNNNLPQSELLQKSGHTEGTNTKKEEREYIDISLHQKKENTPDGVSKKDKLSSPSPSEKIDYSGLMEYYNTTFKDRLQQIRSMTDVRKKAVKARIAQYGKESVRSVFNLILQSPFLLGANDRNWKCDFDWIFKQANFTKILEGNYNGTRLSKNQQDSEQRKRDSVLAVATTVREAAAKKRKELEAEGVIE